MRTQNMTRKVQRSRSSTGSSFSGKTAPSRRPRGTLALGKYLVHELGLAGQRDTLGSWMAHHLGELIHAAEAPSTPSGRARARKEAAEGILRVWAHRQSLPGRAYPLKEYKEALDLLTVLNPRSRILLGYHAQDDKLAATLVESFIRLVALLLLLKLPKGRTSESRDTGAEAMSRSERIIFRTFTTWIDLLPQTQHTGRRAARSGRTSERDLVDYACEAIDLIVETGNKLRASIARPSRKGPSS